MMGGMRLAAIGMLVLLGVGQVQMARAAQGPVAPPVTAEPAPTQPPAIASPSALTASDARLAGDDKRTRLIVDLHGSVSDLNFRVFVLPDPYRVVVDLPQIEFGMPPDTGKHGRGVVSAYRFGLIAPGKSRIVLDLTEPAAVDKSFLLDALDDQPARLVIDLVKTDRAAFLRTAASQRSSDMTAHPQPPQPSPPLLPESQPGLPVVVVDPGHGGIDMGATSKSGEQEKTIVLEFAKRLADKINGTGRYRAVLTRDGDTFISLAGRVQFARANRASLFISVHADTLHDPFGVRGATIYTLSDRASDAESARYAEQENKADAIAGVDLASEPGDVADILIDLTRRETKSFSNGFAKVLIDQFQAAATLNKNPHRSAGFKVLTAPDIPSVLLELGYLSSRDDVKLLTSDDWRSRAADAVVTAIDGFFQQRRANQPAASSGSAPATP
ncbi:N-acetylmuramoyl-L-alanine amidase [Labrys neptuniae]|uniref:N-acetylmuramoyl-L-alanine amidase n=1 Tax=Labrys neptuniae TaxID=376174 RepID=UPI00288E6355|nr:N-acetylmuramoyl-L-alanine amidase [Labrys neptuniae]MDT3379016.1 N-acetylmuramoyl-L-alanine amidase [Labrys neptuniae]